MKIKIVLILISFYKLSFSQTEEWAIYDFDSLVSLEMPFDTYEADTIINYKKIHQIYSSRDSSVYIVQKIYLDKVYSNIETPTLPHDEDSLEKIYLNTIWAFRELIEHHLEYKKPIQEYGLKGYELSFKNLNNVSIQKTKLFFVNKYLYIFTYTDANGLNEDNENIFFESIFFNAQSGLNQYPNALTNRSKNFVIALFIILILSFIFRFKPTKKRRIN